MSILLEAQQEVNTKVNEQHDDIIRQFLERISIVEEQCECGWQKDALRRRKFRDALSDYIDLKLKAHRYIKHLGKVPLAFPVQQIVEARNHLEMYAPCPACIIRHNPTNRRKQTPWNPSRARVWKELLR